MEPSIRARIDVLSPLRRAALERLTELSGAENGSNLAPSTDVECVLAQIWDSVSMHSAFSTETLLIAALLLAWKHEQGCRVLTLDLEGHGRELIASAVDVSRTVGWFTSIYPVCFKVPQTGNVEDLLAEVAQMLHEVPMRGLGYGVLKYLVRLVEAPIVLKSEAASRAHVIDVAVSVVGNQLSVTWEYVSKIMRPHTAAALAENYVTAISELADAVLALPAAARRVPSPEPARSVQTAGLLPRRHRS